MRLKNIRCSIRCWIIRNQQPDGPYLILKSTKTGWFYLEGLEGCVRLSDIYQSKTDAWQRIINDWERNIKFSQIRLADAKAQLLICDT